MAVKAPAIDAESYIEDSVEAAPKHGTTVQAGWGAVSSPAKKASGDYPTDFKFGESARLVRFLDDAPFAVYNQHWIDRSEGRRSFVCIGDGCPLCDIAGDTPRQKVAFNVLVVSDETPNVQILTAPVTLARQLQTANDDPRRGPLSKHYWSLSRLGTGRETQYITERVKATDVAEEWELDTDELDDALDTAVKYDADAIYVSPNEEMLKVARQLVS
jgi:hypothetical protein